MVADMERLENAARTAMGDYSASIHQAPASTNGIRHFLLAASKLAGAMMTRALGKAAA